MTALEQGDIIEVDFNPSVGHEPAKLRPAVVVSVFGFNARSSLVSVVPITTKRHDYPLHVPIETDAAAGWACVEALRNIDVAHRGYRVIGYADDASMKTILSYIRGMFGLR
ncbi:MULTISPECIES: type II toxin-antitoxin system PemK/MazF family toxin [unclassified Adlercreutzia]|uniref:type II toxin-antitoxin system PemK/MazF family toxin n=1 Tax=unclassified Adlercreutzia TaxID=2636013 RepID=UPI0013EDDC5D|nr:MULTISPECIES: type II toxin-antitoxin system PemK/MazF family toxin [unclassified Adlercreutzia]